MMKNNPKSSDLLARRQINSQVEQKEGEDIITQPDAATMNLKQENTSIGFTSFDMKDEKDDGKFDKNGHFVWNKEENNIQEDAWMEGYTEEQMESARKAHLRRDIREESEESEGLLSVQKAKELLGQLLEPGENVLNALRRLGINRPKRSSGRKRQRLKDDMKKEPLPQTQEEKRRFDLITEAAALLMAHGHVDTYSQLQEEFIQTTVLIETLTKERSQVQASIATIEEPSLETMWEYKGLGNGVIHGPYATSTILQWKQQGYFTGEKSVDMRIVRSQHPKAQQVTEKQASAADEMLEDFEDENYEKATDWQPSDNIDFQQFL
uniref:Uncharacterized protein AlNc14C94G5789 n=1 Tax=Albugo laibachii Nc14 TaxID=890382 RepID=F0WGR2_9STRA|nr:conserved hypothetical protein [Albugo laibachii Nc14]|eukprot:CCA20426.1 conserved hypothetical protein [Albugo laibachii Nc14]